MCGCKKNKAQASANAQEVKVNTQKVEVIKPKKANTSKVVQSSVKK